MDREGVSDRWGNEIYPTDERWAHIVEVHEEMMSYRGHVLTTVRTGQRRQDPFDPTKYKSSKRFGDLSEGFSHVVVVVKFAWRDGPQGSGTPNNFILTAYQVSRR